MFAWLKTNGGREIVIIIIIIVLNDKHRLSLSFYIVHQGIKRVGVQLTTIRGRKMAILNL